MARPAAADTSRAALARALLARGLWRLFDVVVLPALLVTGVFLLLARWEAARANRPAAAPGRPPVFHVVEPGDDLRGLAGRYYGDPRQWDEIFHANRARLLGKTLEPGTRLVIPPLPESSATAR